jgi:aryl carrier-like protein
LDGVVYVRLGLDDAWTMQLVKELKAAGYDVDANKVL